MVARHISKQDEARTNEFLNAASCGQVDRVLQASHPLISHPLPSPSMKPTELRVYNTHLSREDIWIYMLIKSPVVRCSTRPLWVQMLQQGFHVDAADYDGVPPLAHFLSLLTTFIVDRFLFNCTSEADHSVSPSVQQCVRGRLCLKKSCPRGSVYLQVGRLSCWHASRSVIKSNSWTWTPDPKLDFELWTPSITDPIWLKCKTLGIICNHRRILWVQCQSGVL